MRKHTSKGQSDPVINAKYHLMRRNLVLFNKEFLEYLQSEWNEREILSRQKIISAS